VSASPRIALVQDALPFMGGAEKVLEAVLEIFPEAPTFTLVYNPDRFRGTIFENHAIYSSFTNQLPWANTHYRSYLPLFPLAIEQIDLREYDVILSFSYAVAHGVLTRPDQLHISFTYTPLRHAWNHYHQALQERGLNKGPISWAVRLFLHYLRLWDFSAAQRVDHFVAISEWVSRLISKAYGRSSRVIYPPVDIDNFQSILPRKDYYLTVSRLAHHKKVDLIVKAFSQLGLPLIVVGEGAEYKHLARLARPNVRLLGWQSDRQIQELLGRAKAFVHAAEEDFGIAIVEAQAAGCPVIAYGSGGALETVISGKTGVLFPEQTVESLVCTVQRFEAIGQDFDISDLRWNASRFSKRRFQQDVINLIFNTWGPVQNREDRPSLEYHEALKVIQHV
jgi:glycosyltransferase involved in cell wall biosynthesis